MTAAPPAGQHRLRRVPDPANHTSEDPSRSAPALNQSGCLYRRSFSSLRRWGTVGGTSDPLPGGTP